MDKQYQFYNACRDGDFETTKALINDPDVDPSDGGNFPIRTAARRGHKDVVKLLMQDSRVDPSAANNWVISLTAFNGHKDIVELLLTDKRVMDKIEYAFEWCKEYGGYEFLKACVDKKKAEERESNVWELIAEMEKDADMWF